MKIKCTFNKKANNVNICNDLHVPQKALQDILKDPCTLTEWQGNFTNIRMYLKKQSTHDNHWDGKHVEQKVEMRVPLLY